MTVIGEFLPEEVLPFVANSPKRNELYPPDRIYLNYRVDMTSLRYHCFKKSLSCVKCGLVGTTFRLEYNNTQLERTPDRAHFNLYSAEGVLMTKDHILPKSKGGKDHIDNLRTYCSPCNHKRGNKDDNIL